VFLIAICAICPVGRAFFGKRSSTDESGDIVEKTESVSVVAPTHVPAPTRRATTTPSPYPTIDTEECTFGVVFQRDVTIPDKTRIETGQPFTKTWRVRNTGTCSWGPGYRLTFVGGDRMGGIESPVPVTPAGKNADISVTLVALVEEGTYRGNWRICVNELECFGDVLYVEIISIASHTPGP